MLEARPSVGSEALKTLLAPRGAKVALAERLKVDASRVSKWIAGQERPPPRERGGIEDTLGISWRTFDDEEVTAEKVDAVVQAALGEKPVGAVELVRTRAVGDADDETLVGPEAA